MKTATIQAGESLSEEIKVPPGHCLFGVVTPSGWDNATLGIVMAPLDSETFYPIYEGNSEVMLIDQIGTNKIMLVNFIPLVDRFKLRSGTDAVPVIQTAKRIFTLLFQSYLWPGP